MFFFSCWKDRPSWAQYKFPAYSLYKQCFNRHLYMQLFLWYRILELELLGSSFWALENIFYLLNFHFEIVSGLQKSCKTATKTLESSNVKSKIMMVQWSNPWNYMLFTVPLQILSVVFLMSFFWDQDSVRDHTWHLAAPSQTLLIRNSCPGFQGFQALDSAGQLFCRISPNWDKPDTFSWLKLGYAFGTRVNYNWCCALLSVFKRSMMFPCLMAGDVNLEHLIKVASLMLLFPHYN